MAATASNAAAYRRGTYTGEGAMYPSIAPSTAAHMPPRGAAAAMATPKGAYLPNTSPLAHSTPPRKLPAATAPRLT